MKKIICVSLCSLLLVGCSRSTLPLNSNKKSRVNIEESTTIHKSDSVIGQTIDTVPAVNAAPALSAREMLEGEWTMLTMKNKKIVARERPFINFDFEEGLFYGCNGCNVINGEFKADPATHALSFSNIISAMMECHNSTSEKALMKNINEVASFKTSEKNGIRYISLLNAKGATLFTLKNQDLNFLNGAWTVKELDGEEVSDDNVRLVIDVPELKLHGNSGCNIVNGSLYVDPDKDWAIQFQSLVSTRKMCPNMNVETALLVALEETEYCHKLSADEIALLDGKGNRTVVLRRLDLQR